MAWTRSFMFLLTVGLTLSAVQQDTLNFGKVAHSKDDAYYDFRYAVNDEQSGVVTDRWESRSGEFVKGAYSLLGPDGKVRSVHYEVDGDHGFKAIVRTDTPGLNLLSIQSAHQVRLAHTDPPINRAPVEPQQLPPGYKPFNYHASPDPLRHSLLPQPLPPQPLPPQPSPPVSAFASAPISLDSSLFSNDLIHRPIIDDENLQTLQELSPPAIDAFARTYDSYPRPVKTDPSRRPDEPVHDVHRTVYSDYVNKDLRRSNPQRSARLISRSLTPVIVPLPRVTPPARASQAKSVNIVSYKPVPVPFSGHSSGSRQYLMDNSPQSFSYSA